jgi:hypothetical protein
MFATVGGPATSETELILSIKVFGRFELLPQCELVDEGADTDISRGRCAQPGGGGEGKMSDCTLFNSSTCEVETRGLWDGGEACCVP